MVAADMGKPVDVVKAGLDRLEKDGRIFRKDFWIVVLDFTNGGRPLDKLSMKALRSNQYQMPPEVWDMTLEMWGLKGVKDSPSDTPSDTPSDSPPATPSDLKKKGEGVRGNGEGKKEEEERPPAAAEASSSLAFQGTGQKGPDTSPEDVQLAAEVLAQFDRTFDRRPARKYEDLSPADRDRCLSVARTALDTGDPKWYIEAAMLAGKDQDESLKGKTGYQPYHLGNIAGPGFKTIFDSWMEKEGYHRLTCRRNSALPKELTAQEKQEQETRERRQLARAGQG
jgi:hypothetical protein